MKNIKEQDISSGVHPDPLARIPVDNDIALESLPDCSHLVNDINALKLVLEESGVALVRGFLPEDIVWKVREEYFRKFPASYFASGSRVVDGIQSGDSTSVSAKYGVAGHPAWSLARSTIYAELVDNQNLKALASELMESAVLRLRRSPIRHFVKGSKLSTPAHIDSEYLSGHSKSALTFWIPIGNCSYEMGGLIYLKGSHLIDYAGLLKQVPAVKNKPLALTDSLTCLTQCTGRPWLGSDYKAGDVLIHRANIVHAARVNKSPVMRLSTDIRYIRVGDEPDKRWADHWSADDGY